MSILQKIDRRTSSTPNQQLSMSDHEFKSFAERINSLAGIVLSDHKRSLVVSRLSKRLRILKLDNFSDYLAYLDRPEGQPEIHEVVNAITTNLTSFFRESHHFEDMVKTLGENASHQRTSDAVGAQRFRIWSAACSTGEEPYSIAMAVHDAGIAVPKADLRILATDIDTAALDTARQAIYLDDRVETCPQGYRKAYFEKQTDDRYQVSSKIRNMITFNQLNIHKAWPMRGPFDVIFCRNILIYFSAESKQDIVARMVNMLRPGGTLYLGHSESMLGNHPSLISQGKTAFRKCL